MRALERLPRDRAIDGIHAFNEMRSVLSCYQMSIFVMYILRYRDGLKTFLRPFAQDGKVVNESDVREFFESLKEAAKKGQ
jgi:E3 ubiquitin-protein ligase UBR7